MLKLDAWLCLRVCILATGSDLVGNLSDGHLCDVRDAGI